jgi:Double-stranded DNA deaminase toxin A
VEAQAAAVLRQPGAPTTASLVINQAPCKDPDTPLICERALRHFIPKDTVLTVYVTDGYRTWRHGVYHGTGEEIVP